MGKKMIVQHSNKPYSACAKANKKPKNGMCQIMLRKILILY